jgi:hypothetical protein
VAGDADAFADAAYIAFDGIGRSGCASFAGANHELPEARKLSGDVAADAFTEIALPRIIAKINEGHDGDNRNCGDQLFVRGGMQQSGGFRRRFNAKLAVQKFAAGFQLPLGQGRLARRQVG